MTLNGSHEVVFAYKDLIAEHVLIQETQTTDTDGFETNYENINDVLSTSEVGIGLIEKGAATIAYQHMGDSFEFDHDTFVIRSDNSGNYRLKITPEDISLFNSNIIGQVYAPYGDIESYVLNVIGGKTWREEAFFSDVFTLEAEEESFLALSMRSHNGMAYEKTKHFHTRLSC